MNSIMVNSILGMRNGPLKVIHDCMKYGIKAKVWIRRYKGLRGVLTGYVVAFDLHMNLVRILYPLFKQFSCYY